MGGSVLKWDSEIWGAIIGPVLTGVLAVLAYLFQQWRRRRRWEDERERAIGQAIQEVQYVDTWLSALQRTERIDPDHDLKLERALLDLERSYQVMSLDLADDEPRPKRRTLAEHISWFLLIPIHGTGAKVVRALYWVMLAITALWIALLVVILSEYPADELASVIVVSIFFSGIAVIPTALIAVWARHLDGRVRTQKDMARSATSPPPFAPFQVPTTGFPDPRAYPPPGPHPPSQPRVPPAPSGEPGPPRPVHPPR